MNMMDWAENEVKIACEKQHPGLEEGEWDYGCACYKSALKAYKSLMEDGHSGYSFGITASILKRLVDGTPLTPIEDTDDIWREAQKIDGSDHQSLQCIRRSSLFKYVYDDGRIEYRDIDRFLCISISNSKRHVAWHNGFVNKIMSEYYPITFPYSPDKPIKVYCEELLTDRKNGDFDTIGVLYCEDKDSKKDICRYFKEDGDGWTEISVNEYLDRIEMDNSRCEKESKDD